MCQQTHNMPEKVVSVCVQIPTLTDARGGGGGSSSSTDADDDLVILRCR